MVHQLAYTREFVKLAPKGALRAFYNLYEHGEKEGKIGQFTITKQDKRFPGKNHQDIWIANGNGQFFFIKQAKTGGLYDGFASFILLQNLGLHINVPKVRVVGNYLGYADKTKSFLVLEYLSPEKFTPLGPEIHENRHLHLALADFRNRAQKLFGADDIKEKHAFLEKGKDRIVIIDPIGYDLELGETYQIAVEKLSELGKECRQYGRLGWLLD